MVGTNDLTLRAGHRNAGLFLRERIERVVSTCLGRPDTTRSLRSICDHAPQTNLRRKQPKLTLIDAIPNAS